ncbi:MAG TPA: circularly permuted type 2 ATP-grasp protein [Thermoleophilaceae bacterium]|nr:circularly permuted type 2 ATP-grasp protein [Thermoleophilaceae bacterium]
MDPAGTGVLSGYCPPAGVFDEAVDAGGRVRDHYRELLGSLADPGELAAETGGRLRARRVTFGAAPGGIFALDPVPRLLRPDEWAQLEAGISQRLRALDSFVGDVYGDGEVFDAGVVPRGVVEGSPHFEPAMRGARPGRWVAFAGLDLARGPDGRFRVIEDQVRMPSGLAYAVAARETLRELLPVESPPADLSTAFGELALALRDAAPEGVDEPSVVLLCEGPEADGWWEHDRLARELCAPAVTLADLEHRGGRLVAWIDGRPRGVDVVYQRTDEDRFTHPDGTPTALGQALLGPCSESRLACVNAPGSGVADDKLVHAYVDDLVRFYVDEEPLLSSVPGYDLGDEDARSQALGRLDELVVKPRGEMGGEDVVLWRYASEDERRRARRAIEREPQGMVAQELVTLSTHPTVCDGRLEPRHVDLRPYALLDRSGARVLPGGLSRVALERGSLVVNSGRGGGAKDTWVPETRRA